MRANAVIELVGILAVCAMVTFYAVEDRAPIWTLAFSAACWFAAMYAFLIGSSPFMIAEGIWANIAFKKWRVRANWLVPTENWH
jgi:hypothetical protein